jgi:GxxExxY protein
MNGKDKRVRAEPEIAKAKRDEERSEGLEKAKDGGGVSIWDIPRAGPGLVHAGCGCEETEQLARVVIGAAIEVHRELGPCLPEMVYERALSHELRLRKVPHERQAPLPVMYKGEQVGEGRMDLLIRSKLVVELKSCESLTDLHRAQVRSYLHLTNLRLGLLINFNVPVLRNGIRRIIHTL